MGRHARHVTVAGRVQGVFFRAWTRDLARQLGVTGWVRNCPDGSVEAHVEGEEQDLERLVDRMRGGPRAAEVTEILAREVEPCGFKRFEVRD
ncbi:MAG TPA: acylphosphatase [Sphingomicrobium sp.]|nr:acylphosphatase [Sphingomicrobium sp.]